MQIGRKIYFEKITGNVILDTGERQGNVIETTQEQDFAMYAKLQGYIQDAIGLLQLAYGQHSGQFQSCFGYRINPETEEIIFNYIPSQASLEEAKAAKIAELDKACNTEILAGFHSAVKDGNRLYGLDYDDQLNMEALKNNVAMELIPDGALEYYCKGGPCEPWSNTEFMVLYGQAMTFKTERIKTCKAKKELTKAAASIEDLEVIVWVPLS
jgi:hypothetical protein